MIKEEKDLTRKVGRVCLSEEELRASMLVDRLLGNYSMGRKGGRGEGR